MRLIIIFLVLFPIAIRAAPLLLGVVEQSQYGVQDEMGVRVLFQKQGKDWIAIDSVERAKDIDATSIRWTITFDGQNLGLLETIDPNPENNYEYSWTFPRDKRHKIKDLSAAPRIKNKQERFSGWSFTPIYRPVVLVSQPNFSDKEKWKPFNPQESYRELLYPYMKGILSSAYHCEDAPDYNAKEFEYKAGDLELFKSYQNIKKQKLVSIGIHTEHIKNCDGLFDPKYTPNWFYIDNENVVHIGNEMEVIDAGDYDVDGEVEMIFWHSGYNEDGYSIFYENLKKRADFFWTYH